MLAEELGWLPLALEHAGAYVETTGCTLAEYQRLLATQRARLWDKAKAPDAYHATITTTWELSFQQVRAQNPAAIALFNLCCFLAPEDIPLSLLQEHKETLPEELAVLLADDLALNEAIGDLRRYSLLARDGEMLAVHRLVQSVARDQMPKEKKQKWAELAVDLMLNAWLFNQYDMETWEPSRRLLIHLLTVAEVVNEQSLMTQATARLNAHVDFHLDYFGNKQAALSYSKRALEISERVLGPDHPDTASSLNNLGYLLQAMGELAAAKPYYERALNIFAQKLGEEHPNTTVVRENLAALAGALGRGE
jgi:tetratricopeptide (TPR) repeat protein